MKESQDHSNDIDIESIKMKILADARKPKSNPGIQANDKVKYEPIRIARRPSAAGDFIFRSGERWKEVLRDYINAGCKIPVFGFILRILVRYLRFFIKLKRTISSSVDHKDYIRLNQVVLELQQETADLKFKVAQLSEELRSKSIGHSFPDIQKSYDSLSEEPQNKTQ